MMKIIEHNSLSKSVFLKKSAAGFTLIEILLALAILGVGLASILGVFAVGARSVRRTLAMTNASFIAQATFSYCNAIGYDAINTAKTSGNESSIVPSVINSSYSGYTVAPTIGTVSGPANLYKIDLNVKEETLSETFTTYIAKQNP